MPKRPKPHENGLILEGDGWAGWHWSATPERVREDWRASLERWRDCGLSFRVKRVEMGQVVEEVALTTPRARRRAPAAD